MPNLLTIDLDKPLSPELIARALQEASPLDILAQAGRVRNAARKTHSGGRNGGRPKKTPAAPAPAKH